MLIKYYQKPQSIKEAYELLLQNEHNTIIGGGAWLKLTNKNVETIIDLSSIGLNEIIESSDEIEIGAMTSLRQIETSDIITKYHGGILCRAVKSIMGMNIRNIATIGGSVFGKYSFSDIITPLLVMDTSLVFYNSGTITLEEFVNTKKFPKDILLKIVIKKQTAPSYFKTVKKTALDFSVLNVAISNGDKLKIAVGARPGLTIFAEQTMAFLQDREITKADIIAGAKMARDEIKVSSNSRASKEYREELVEVYIRRGLMEVFGYES